MRKFEYYIESDNITVLDMLRKHLYSRRNIILLKNTDMGLTVDNKLVFTNHLLNKGDILCVKIQENIKDNIVPKKIKLDILFEDEDILIINKQSNLSVHPTMGNYYNTLANGVAFYLKENFNKFRIINRLDKDTSGLLIIAKNVFSANILYSMMKNRDIKREYLAICSGHIPNKGTINAGIKRLEGSTIERCVNREYGENAITHFEKIHTVHNLNLIKLNLETGRTHQIRVHMKYMNAPIIGDFLYNPDFRYITRQALHSHKLTFKHPITGQILKFIEPIPNDMENALKV